MKMSFMAHKRTMPHNISTFTVSLITQDKLPQGSIGENAKRANVGYLGGDCQGSFNNAQCIKKIWAFPQFG